MKATRILLLVGVGVSLVAAGGCKETYTIKFTNVTNEMQVVRILDQNGFPDVDGLEVAAGGGRAACKITQDENDVISYTVKTSKNENSFVIKKGADNPMYFRISPNGILGPMSAEAKGSDTWKTETTVPIRTGPKIE